MPSAAPQTIEALIDWMAANQCNDYCYQIGEASIYEGHILRETDACFEWLYTERGNESLVETFADEGAAVDFAFNQIARTGNVWCQMIGFVKNKRRLVTLQRELLSRNIGYFSDQIPYGGPTDPRYRVYVHVDDVERSADLYAKYGEIG